MFLTKSKLKFTIVINFRLKQGLKRLLAQFKYNLVYCICNIRTSDFKLQTKEQKFTSLVCLSSKVYNQSWLRNYGKYNYLMKRNISI